MTHIDTAYENAQPCNVLIVGGAVGGRVAAHCYARNGNQVIIADINVEDGQELTNHLNQRYSNGASFYESDATDPLGVEQLCRNIKRDFGYLNHVVSVVGGSLHSDWQGLEKGALADIENTTRLNLLSHQYVMRYTKALLVACPDTNRSIALMGSINALRGFDLPAYSAAKAGMSGLMYGAAREYTMAHGIRINIVAPGTTMSERTKKLPKNTEILMSHALLPDMPDPEEIAEALYTLTHRLPHCTQQMLVIDSGQTAYGPPHNLLYE